MTGKVYITGAGCGKADMMSLRAFNVLKAAEVVVYDRILGDGVFELIPESAEKINAGKAGGNHLIPQDGINQILLEKAKEGKNVVRLKGGDPFMFGRGGEEAEFLYQNGISFEIIPGISSAYAVPELAGIPVTHRDIASSVHILTGHFKADGGGAIDYKALVAAGGTYVFLMGLGNADKIKNGFISAGLGKNTPCAVIENGGTAKQRVGVSGLAELTELAANFSSPAVIVIGGVCKLHEKLRTSRPLAGRKILISRPSYRAQNLKTMLETAGAEVFIAPSIKITPLEISGKEITENIEKSALVAFTSRTGVELAFEKLFSAGYDARVFGGKKIAAVGSGTAEELQKYGIKADLMPQKFYTAELAKLIATKKADNILLLRAQNGSREMDDILTENNIKHKTLYLYKTEAAEQVLPADFDTAVFASPSEAEYFAKTDKTFTAVCIGAKTYEAAQKRGFKAVSADFQTDSGLFESICEVKI